MFRLTGDLGPGWTLAAMLAAITAVTLAAWIMRRRQPLAARAKHGQQDDHHHLAAVFRAIGDGVIVCDAEGRVSSMNPVAERLCGWPAAEATGRPLEEVFRIVNAHTRQPALNPVPQAIAGGVATGLANDTLLIDRNGREIAIADSCAPILGPEGRPVGAVLVFRDVTELYRAHRELAESEQRYRLLAEHALAALATHELIRDDQGRVVDSIVRSANRQFKAQSGLDAEQIIGRRLTEWLPAEEASYWLAQLDQVDRSQQSRAIEKSVDSLGRQFLVQIWPIRHGTVGVAFVDVTRQRLTEQKAVRLGRILEASRNEIYVFDAETLRFVEASRSALDALGYTIDELRQLTPLDLKPEYDRQSFETLLAPLRQGAQQTVRFRTRHRCKDGSTYPVDVRLELLEEGSRRLFLAAIENTAEREEAERRWQGEHSRLMAIVGSAQDAIVMLDPQRLVLLWNPAAETLFGIPAEQACGQCLGRLLQMEPASCAEDPLTRQCWDWLRCESDAPAPGKRVALTVRGRRGEPLDIEISVAATALGGQTHYVVVMRDISEPMSLRRQLAESEQRYRVIVEHAADLVWTVSRDGRICYASPSWQQVTGYRPEELQGQPFRPGIHPDDWPLASQALENLFEGRTREEALAYRVLHADGSWHWHEGRGVAVHDALGKVVSVVGVSRDITQRRRVEEELHRKIQELESARQSEQAKAEALAEALQQLEEARSRAEQASRAKTDFLARMSHEMRTPLNAILGMAVLVRDRARGREEAEQVEAILSSCRNLLHLIDELLDVSAIEAGRLRLDPEPFLIVQLLDDVIGELALAAADKGLELIGSIRPGTPPMLIGDARRLRQILLNLAGNAIKYTEQGHVRISLAWTQAQQSSRKGMFEISVADTGPGIPAEKIPLVFEKFAQLDETGARRAGGVGLGLAIVRQLVELMQGEVSVQSLLGKGTIFCVSIPMKQAAAADLEQPLFAQPGWNFWVVSEAPQRRQAVAELLRWLGAQTLEADSLTPVNHHLRQHRTEKIALLLWADEYSQNEIDYCRQMINNWSGSPPVILLATSPAAAVPDVAGVVVVRTPLRCAALQTALVQAGIARCSSGPSSARPESKSPTPRWIDPHRTPGALSRPKVLVAEDNLLNQRVAAGLLAKLGMDYDLVSNGRQAIEALRRNHYDLVLLDLSMPEMDGLEAAQWIRKEWGQKNLQPPPLVALTAHVLPEERRRCIDAGMNDFLAKPVSLEALLGVLTRWIPGPSPSQQHGSASQAMQSESGD
ncbi:MAG: PAS domain S-box protein [Bryobacteraceae bacterium]